MMTRSPRATKVLFRPFSRPFLAAGLGAALASATASAALVSYYNFDGSNNNDSVGANHGQVNNQTGYSASTPDGSAFSLDLSGTVPQDYVRLGDASPNGPDFGISATNSLTISMWVNYSVSERGIVTIRQDLTSGGGDRSGITFGLNATGNPFVGFIHSTIADDAANNLGSTFHDVTTDQVVATGTWTHMAMTYNSLTDVLRVFVDGVAAGSYDDANGAGTIALDGSNLTGGVGVIDFVDPNGSFTGFGASGNGPQIAGSAGDFTRLYYDGLLDDVAIWNNALPDDQVALLASGISPLEVPEPATPLLALLTAALAVFRRRR